MIYMRTFLALPIEESLKEYIGKKIEFYKKNISSKVKWVENDNLHFTIFFFGEIEDKIIPELIKVIDINSRNFKQIKITLNNISFFPNEKNPRVIFFSLKEGEKEMKEIYDTLFNPFSKIITMKKEEFKSHLTIGRVKQGLNEQEIGFLIKDNIEQKKSILKKITLFQSTLTPKGPIYKPIKDFPLF